jgi:putative ABC transport system permease protein
MNFISRGIRNAFRNTTRTLSLTVILGLSIGLSLAMLIAHQAVGDKINSIKSSVGNTITISPAGFNPGAQANNALTTDGLDKVKSLSHVAQLTETLTDRLSTTGTSQPSFGFGRQGSQDSSSSTTSLKSPVELNTNRQSGNQGRGFRVFVNGGGSLPSNFSPPVSFLGTNDASALDNSRITVRDGKSIDGTKDTNEALISSQMASKNSLKVGSTFTAYNTTLTVAGIFDGSTRAGDGTVILSLPAEQRLSGQSGAVTGAVATVDSLDNLSSATSAIKSALGSGADVISSQEQADDTVKPLQNISSISLYSLIGAAIAGAAIILMTMVMITRERRREIGVLKAIGAGNSKIMSQFMVEAVTLTVLAAIIGIVLGALAGSPMTHMLVSDNTGNGAGPARGPGGGAGMAFRAGGRGFGAIRDNVGNIHAAVGWDIVLYGLAAALIIALIGSALTSFLIAKVRPAEVMRAE